MTEVKRGVLIDSDDELVRRKNAVDVAEISDGQIMIANPNEKQNIITGSIFGAYGKWRMWHEENETITQYVVDTPFTVPPGIITFEYQVNDRWLKRKLGGKIKRLKKLDVTSNQ